METQEEQGFLEDEDDFDNFGFQLESDSIQKIAERYRGTRRGDN